MSPTNPDRHPAPRRPVAALVAALATASLAPPPAPAAEPVPASVRIDASRPAGRISPQLYGQFVEFMFEGVKGGLHAERLRGRGFEGAPNAIGVPRPWERYPDDRNDDYGLIFAWDDRVEYPPGGPSPRGGRGHSLRVDAGGGVITRRGIYQPRLPIRAGVVYRASLWLRTRGYGGKVLVALESDVDGGGVYAEAAIDGVAGDWRRYEVMLRPEKSDPLARLAILFPGRGRVWIDQASLMPGDAVGVVRRDVFEAARALRPAFVRWPGGNVAQDYHWRWGIGPRDRRPTWANPSWRNEPEPSDFGTDEYLAFCRALGAAPAICVNVEGAGATAEEAAAWVAYCNAPASSPMGALRAAGGHPEPFDVRLWELGNEVWGPWVRGYSDAATYAANAARYAEAIRRVDPRVRLIAVGDNDPAWNRAVLRAAGPAIDYLAIHHYYGQHQMGGDLRNVLARPLRLERFYRRMAALIAAEAPGRPIRLAINEWGLDLPTDVQYGILPALYAGRLMNVFERSSDVVALSSVSDLVNGWPGGIIQAGRQALFVTPIYHVNRLYAEHLGADRLDAEVTGPSFDTSREGLAVPCLDASASRSVDGSRIFLKLVNADLARPLDTAVEVAGASPDRRASLSLVRARSPNATNSFATPDAIAIERSEIPSGRRFSVTLPPASVSVLSLRVSPPASAGAGR